MTAGPPRFVSPYDTTLPSLMRAAANGVKCHAFDRERKKLRYTMQTCDS